MPGTALVNRYIIKFVDDDVMIRGRGISVKRNIADIKPVLDVAPKHEKSDSLLYIQFVQIDAGGIY
jgi:hypothetical protein